MRQTDAIIIGAGQAGLAMSYCLSRLGIEHIVLERGRVAERWRSERWDSLRLLTPNWMSRLAGLVLPGHGTRRVHDCRRSGRVPRAVRDRCPGARGHWSSRPVGPARAQVAIASRVIAVSGVR